MLVWIAPAARVPVAAGEQQIVLTRTSGPVSVAFPTGVPIAAEVHGLAEYAMRLKA